MADQSTLKYRSLEGRRVGMTLTGGARIEDCQVICAPRHGTSTLWVLLPEGADAFVPLAAVVEIWEVASAAA
ncbi:MAG: hypothetical protein M3357_16400 [Actinomycetota bacterium]|jgi:hypothetical protein|nr:hypothetical protein [Actinomycetota bacterium]